MGTAGNDSFVFLDSTVAPGGAGTALDPTDTLTNARGIVIANGLRRAIFMVRGFHSFPALDWTDFTFRGPGAQAGGNAPQIDFAARSFTGSSFQDIFLFGDAGNSRITATDCPSLLTTNLGNGSRFNNCSLFGDHSSTELMFLLDCKSTRSLALPFAWDCTLLGAAEIVNIVGFAGTIIVKNLTDATSGLDITGMLRVDISSSVTDGQFVIAGLGRIINSGIESTAGSITIDKSAFVERGAGSVIRCNARRSGTGGLVVLAGLELAGDIVKAATNATLNVYNESSALVAGPTLVASPNATTGLFSFSPTGFTFPSGSDTILEITIDLLDADGVARSGRTGTVVTA